MPESVRHPELSRELEKVRSEKKQSIRHIAIEINLDYGHTNRVFHGQALPSRRVLVNICKALGCTHDQAIDIFNQTDYRAPTQQELDGQLAQSA